MNISYLNYCALYKAIPLDDSNYGEATSREADPLPCFGRSLEQWGRNGESRKIRYEIRMKRTEDFGTERSRNNYCPFTIDQIKEVLDSAKRYMPSFVYEVIDNGEEYQINVEIEGKKISHLFVLTTIRHFYEAPFNLFLLDALKLKHSYCFKLGKESIMNLLCVIGSSYPKSWCDDQSFGVRYGYLLSDDEIKSRLSSSERLSSVYNTHNHYHDFSENERKYIRMDSKFCSDTRYWTSGHIDFLRRVNKYNRSYEMLTK